MARKHEFTDAVARGNNFIAGLLWTALGAGGIAAGAHGYGGVFVMTCGIGALLYGLYGFFRVFFF